MPRRTDEWSSRPLLGALVSMSTVALPLLATVAVAVVARHDFPSPHSVGPFIFWLLGQLALSALTYSGVSHLTLRLLPLAALLKMTLVFPRPGAVAACRRPSRWQRPQSRRPRRARSWTYRLGDAGRGGRDHHRIGRRVEPTRSPYSWSLRTGTRVDRPAGRRARARPVDAQPSPMVGSVARHRQADRPQPHIEQTRQARRTRVGGHQATPTRRRQAGRAPHSVAGRMVEDDRTAPRAVQRVGVSVWTRGE